jgi:hypothetical protein
VAGKSAVLAISIVSDAKGAAAGFTEAESRTAKFQRGLDKASVAAAGVVTGIAAVAKEAFDAASELQQSTGAIDSVFGDWALDIEQAAQGAAESVGLATSAYENSAALIGAQLKGMGFPIDENVKKTQELIAQGADLAATFGGSTEEAVSALSSALKGERDPIERYGITLSQAAVDAKIAALGLDTSTDAAARNAQAQATLAIIAEQGASAQGSFAREADTAAGQTQRAGAAFENAKAALGDVLLPIVAAAAQKLAALAGWLVKNKDVIVPLVAVVGGLAVGIIALNAAMRAYSVVQTIVNAVINASPLMRLVLIITGIVGAVIYMYNKFSWFRDLMQAIGGFLGSVFDGVISAIGWVVDKLSWIGDAASWVGDLFSASGTVALTPVAAGSAAGLFGSAGGVAAGYTTPTFGASMTSLGGGGSTAAQGPGGNVYITVTGALDPDAVARQIEKILRNRARNTGGQVSLVVGRAST